MKAELSPGETSVSLRVSGASAIGCEGPLVSSSEDHFEPGTTSPPMQTTKAPAGAAPLKRNRDFRLLLRGSSVSMLGSRVSAIAYPLLVLALTRSPVVAGWACFATIAPSVLFYLPAGALVDRWPPRRAMLLSESGRGAAVAVIVAALLLHSLSIPVLVAIGAIEQVLEVFSVLAERRLVRSVVEPKQAASALARTEARTHLVILVGRPLGAFLFGFWRVLPFLTDVLSFVVSVTVLAQVGHSRGVSRACQAAGKYLGGKTRQGLHRLRSNPFRRSTGQPARMAGRRLSGEIRECLHWLRMNPFVGIGLPLTAGTTLIGQALIMVFLAQAQRQDLSSLTIGIVLAASGAGGALGSAAASYLFHLFKYSLLRSQMWVWAATFGFLALTGGRSYIVVAVAMAFLGFTGALGNIALDTFVVSRAAETMLARVMSVGRMASFGALAIGPALGGVLYERWGTRDAMVALLIAMCLLLVPASSRRLRPTSDHRRQLNGRYGTAVGSARTTSRTGWSRRTGRGDRDPKR
jgi:MFS family permease